MPFYRGKREEEQRLLQAGLRPKKHQSLFPGINEQEHVTQWKNIAGGTEMRTWVVKGIQGNHSNLRRGRWDLPR